MSVFVECKPDETTAVCLGVPKVIHGNGRPGVCSFLQRYTNSVGMVDEDPNAVQPSYLRELREVSRAHDLVEFEDKQGNNRLIIVCPRLEEWLVATSKLSGLKLTDFGFESDNGHGLHGEINQRLSALEKLIRQLLDKQNPRIVRLKNLLIGSR